MTARRTRVAWALPALVLLLAVAVTRSAGAGSDVLSTVAGSGTAGFSGDGGPAVLARLLNPFKLSPTADGGFLVVDAGNARIRKVGPPPGRAITTVAGGGTPIDFIGDGGPATAARLAGPQGVAAMPDGGFVIADGAAHRVRRVAPDGVISTVLGAPNTQPQLNGPADVSAMSDGSFLVADFGGQVIRKVAADGTATVVAGNGSVGFSGDGGPATSAQLSFPFAVAATPDGGFLIVDSSNRRIRRVARDGVITTVAGTGIAGFSGDGGPATLADLGTPVDVDPTPDGGFVIADSGALRLRKVAADGTITTLAGNGLDRVSPDGSDALTASLASPNGVAVTPDARILVSELNGQRVRMIGPGGGADTSLTADAVPFIAIGATARVDFGSLSVGASATGTPNPASLIVTTNGGGYSLSATRTAFSGGSDIPLSIAVTAPTGTSAGFTGAKPIPAAGSLMVGSRSAGATSAAGEEWRPVYALGPVPFRPSGPTTATVTFTAVAQ